MRYLKKSVGFTLIELLVVIAILAILLTITLIAINPAKQFADANNTKRRSDTLTLLNAINQYAIDNNGNLPTGISTLQKQIRKTGGADLCALLAPKYISALPTDPAGQDNPISDCSRDYNTGYSVLRNAFDNRITVIAPLSENNQIIEVTR